MDIHKLYVELQSIKEEMILNKEQKTKLESRVEDTEIDIKVLKKAFIL